MKITKRQLKRIIREEYSRIISENHIAPYQQILDLSERPGGVDLDEINHLFGKTGFDIIDEMIDENLVWLDDQEGIVYAKESPGINSAIEKYLK
ncbi:MAG: hypothetical protein CBC29_06715 [Methylococcaceae bacterium TMED69]|nr:MAG: hypothetical protein CBC29_06715 [Methylococcaceae bacterium TMED69]|tara:strand:+ start:1359 stop:1640 length:282 start_codon:yes stop_codon:yes gene_type:complete